MYLVKKVDCSILVLLHVIFVQFFLEMITCKNDPVSRVKTLTCVHVVYKQFWFIRHTHTEIANHTKGY
jgi:hypothetical protein